ncbi:VanZ family protein [Anaerocolumna jejuensis]|uniref:VanZ family protein n=1 Tax=Anaerocolumna jejuensis TaxID=259063 RepID=UPI003F7C597A
MFQTEEYLLPGFAASLLFLLIDEILIRLRGERVTWFHRILILLTGLYMTEIFAVTLSPGSALTIPHSFNNINLVPFKVLKTAFSNPLNFWGNIFLFIPLGILLVLLFNHCQRFPAALITGAGISLLIEVLQLFGIRATDIDDVLLNTTGLIIGYFYGKILAAYVPFIRRNVGIFKRNDGKLARKRHDAGGFASLTVVILLAITIKAYFLEDKDFLPPVMPNEITQKSAPAPTIAIHKSKEISASIDAKNAFLWDLTSNTVLYEKDSNKPIAPASTTKMLTALTTLDYCDVNDRVLVGKEVQLIAGDASRAWLNPGNELTIRQLFDALLLPSGNDAAYALAVYTGKKICRDSNASIDKALHAFLKEMNKKAVKIGASHSHFKTPDGYDTEGQYTTAKDLALIARELLKSDTLRKVVNSYKLSDLWLSGQSVTYYNTNELINPKSPYYYKNAAGLKTGNSDEAGSCLVSCADIKEGSYICVIMGSTKEGRWQDSIKLYNAIR